MINFAEKTTFQARPEIPETQKFTASNANEIKAAVNALYNVVVITYEDALALVTNDDTEAEATVIPGQLYKITGRGDRGIFLTGMTFNRMSTQGFRIMLCPATYATGTFDGNTWIGVWRSSKTAASGDLTIWGGKVWRNKTGSIGTSESLDQLDTTNWEFVPKDSFENGEYVELVLSVDYDIAADYINRQWDGQGVSVSMPKPIFLATGLPENPVESTDWNFRTCGCVLRGIVTMFGFCNNVADNGFIVNISAGGVQGNDVPHMQDIKCNSKNTDTSSDADAFAVVVGNKCQQISDIYQTGGVTGVPANVDQYVFHTDDESFYFEIDCSVTPLDAGAPFYRNCIIEKDASLMEWCIKTVEVEPDTANISGGIETDAPTHMPNTLVSVLNGSGYKNCTPSSPTTANYRRFVLLSDTDITQGRIKVSGKYL